MLEIKNISARLGSFSLNNISLTAQQGDYLSILGLSGAGKTVLLEILAGLVKPSGGNILLDGKDITHMSIQKRPFSLVYQDMALFPHMRVKNNIAFPLKGKLNKVQIIEKVNELAEKTRVTHLLNRHPATLSGGEAQRVALARALAADPQILLLDEPLASLDIKLRQELRELLREINKSGKTIIHVTHDHTEMATLSNKIAIIENGELLQWGTPDEVFRNPVSEFAARFSGIRNIFLCEFSTINEVNDHYEGKTSRGTVIKLMQTPQAKLAHLIIPGEDIIVSETPLHTSAMNQFKGMVKEVWYLHHGVELIITAGDDFSVMISKTSADNLAITKGKNVWISFKASAVKIL